MTNNEQLSSTPAIEYDYRDLSNSPFFADFDPTIPINTIALYIPRPHRPPMRPEFTRDMIEYLKKLTETSTLVQPN